ncbi:type II toxin-antitoxin system CcdA family antitoxin [Loktanella sp. DJP18]|uniref:type II toxin-antitoxin system CcdA family antitoxin n=1 Tax=Loktanella sp. DJP18 TaxID=3409788 RepID=UPI003BB61989
MSDRKTAMVDLDLDATLVDEAQRLGIDIPRVIEEGLASAVRAEVARLWCSENADALKDYNDHVEREGLPLSHYRAF